MPVKPLLVESKHFHTLALIGCLLLCIGVITPCLASGKSLIAGVIQDHPPHSWIGRDQQPLGIQIDLLRALEHRQGTNIEFRPMPHGRLVRELILGNLDMAVVVVVPDELDLPPVDSLVTTVQPVLEIPLDLYSSRRRRIAIEGLEDFENLNDFSRFQLGFMRMGFNKAHTTLQSKSHIVFFIKADSMIKSLLSARIDLIALDPLVADYWGKKLSADLQLQYRVIAVPVHILFSKKALGPQALPICNGFWQQLVKLQQSGALESVFSGYQHPELISYIAPRQAGEGPACQVVKQDNRE